MLSVIKGMDATLMQRQTPGRKARITFIGPNLSTEKITCVASGNAICDKVN